MNNAFLKSCALLACLPAIVRADVVTEWNAYIRQAVQADATMPNPGWSSRAMAMANGAIYDSFMAINRTHEPFKVDTTAPATTSREAAAAQAAHDVLVSAYPLQAATFNAALENSLNAIPNSPNKTAGIDLGASVAAQYIAARAGDGSDVMIPYMPSNDPGKWRPDPLHPAQEAWGPAWGSVTPFSMLDGSQFQPPSPPALTSEQYTIAFNDVKLLGARDSATRTADQKEIGLFWAYDRQGMGPPPVIYNRNVAEIAQQMGNTLEENARLFAMTMIASADAGIASWDCKYIDNFWRPITGIREADTDGNPDTTFDPTWVPLGAPGADPMSTSDDFTPPFPAYVSGHATFGAAVFGALAEFYGSDVAHFTLTSEELPGVTRDFDSFSEASAENARSRIYLGIHWSFDDEQGRAVGGAIANWIGDNYFQPVPEPGTVVLASVGGLGMLLVARRRLAKR